jgi:hypothetical protein
MASYNQHWLLTPPSKNSENKKGILTTHRFKTPSSAALKMKWRSDFQNTIVMYTTTCTKII